MWSRIVALCGDQSFLSYVAMYSDYATAAAYFSIPISLGIVFLKHNKDIPHSLLLLFSAAFIVSCGTNHLVHGIYMNETTLYHTLPEVIARTVMATISVITASLFMWRLPDIRRIKSPREHRAALEAEVSKRTVEKDMLVWEINHRVGNQLQTISSLIRIERRKAGPVTAEALDRLQAHVMSLGDDHMEAAKELPIPDKDWRGRKRASSEAA